MAKFSRATIVETISYLDALTHAELDRLLLKYDLEKVASSKLGSKTARLNALMQHLFDHPDEKGPLGSDMAFELIEYVVGRVYKRNYDITMFELYPEELTNVLRQDGYTIEEGKLKSMLPESIRLAEQSNQLDSLLSKYNFSTARGHLELARNAHTRGEWASANAQLRSFVEALFDSIAEKLAGDTASIPSTSALRREFLATMKPPFFLTNLNEWEINGKGGFIQGLWRRLNPEGSHPGLSDEEDSTFRLHTVLLTATHYLRRLDQRIRKND